jgi:hypothetical protein
MNMPRLASVALFSCFLFVAHDSALCQPAQEAKSAVVNKEHPVDSLGETVYSKQDQEDKDQPVVPGLLVYPHPVSTAEPKYSKALKKEKFEGAIAVLAVITPTGKVIDVETDPEDDAEAVACARAAVVRYLFTAPTLDGKPVAIRLKVVVNFRLHR